MKYHNLQQLIQFLKTELALSSEQIQVALRQSQRQHGPLPMLLWQYGFITIEQLDDIQQ
ncbi:DUF2949 domain-containing protein [filamentous cyanobacterium LEGE 11480]|uniref:DUF2949 domain-containing protein n=1 Tax=Romeriopsis navalis LEGE 11480 TaxID=2777977 RepID=A0A928Z4W0_9CYAN|nr:DUF2949 domain-containing protein [Romeriopsis navalis]MBE9031427.1 DUF2949 domain-containing protein [Romeriopsis navalis LEGE 11480]